MHRTASRGASHEVDLPNRRPAAGAAATAGYLALALWGCGADGGSGGTGGGAPSPGGSVPTEVGLRVAFISDQGLGPDAAAVLELIRDEQADAVIHAGGLDYADDPDGWDLQITDVLGETFPYFASVGSHDEAEWDGYRDKIQTRIDQISAASCSGDPLGVASVCTFRGLSFILSGVGTWGSFDHASFIEQALAADDAIWRICSWHANRADFQPGGRGDEVPIDAYQLCAMGRALIVNGNEQSYGRTLTLTDIDNPSAGYRPTGGPDLMQVTAGSTFVAVSGLGGESQRDYVPAEHGDDTWWATIYAGGHYLQDGQVSTFFDYDFGALFVDFYVDGNPRRARGTFKTVGGEVVDEFWIETAASLPGQ